MRTAVMERRAVPDSDRILRDQERPAGPDLDRPASRQARTRQRSVEDAVLIEYRTQEERGGAVEHDDRATGMDDIPLQASQCPPPPQVPVKIVPALLVQVIVE